MWLCKPVIKYGIYLFRGTVCRYRVGIIDTVDKTQEKGFIGGKPVVFSIELGGLDVIGTLPQLGSKHLTEGVFKTFYLLQHALQLFLATVATAAHAV